MIFRDVLFELLDYPVSEWYRHDYGSRYDREVTYSFMVGTQLTSVGRFALRFFQMDDDAQYWQMKFFALEENGSGEAKRTVRRSENNRMQFKVYPTVLAVIKDFIQTEKPKKPPEIGFTGADDRLIAFYHAAKDRLTAELNPIGYEVHEAPSKDEWYLQPIGTNYDNPDKRSELGKKKKLKGKS